MPARLLAAAAMAVGFTAAPAHAIYIRHDRAVAEHNNIANKAPFAPTGYIADRDWGISFASGTLISPTKVLTAAHPFDGDGDLKLDSPGVVGRLSFGTARNVPGSFTNNIKSVAINPAYKGGLAGFDLAVLTLKNPITSVTGAKLSSANAAGKRGALVGYGYQGKGNGGNLSGATNKLAAYNTISRYEGNTYKTDFDSPAGNRSTFTPSAPLHYEGTTAAGDSGGPLYADFGTTGNEVWRIVGILNGGFNTFGRDSLYGDISIYAALNNPKNISFLQAQGLPITASTSASTATSPRAADLRGASPVPEPTTALLAAAAGGLLLMRRRRA